MLINVPLGLVGVACTLLGGFGLLGLFTAMEGLVRATILVPMSAASMAFLSMALLSRRTARPRTRTRAVLIALVVLNAAVLAGLTGCTIFAPFTTQDLRIVVGDHALAGTLYVPRTQPPYPGIVLVHGSTRQTRNSLGGLYRTNAAALARRGIAALVYDKRGCGESSGNFDAALLPEFAEDAHAAVGALAARDDILANRVGLWGISAGGWAAPLAAAGNETVAFLVLVSAPAVPEADQRLFEWAKRIRADGASEQYIASALAMRRKVWMYYATGEDWDELSAELDQAREQLWWSSIRAVFPDGVAEPEDVASTEAEREFRWHRTDCFRDPVAVLREVDAPILAIYGTDDSIIDIERNLPLMRAAMAGRDDGVSAMRVFEGAGHAMFGSMVPPRLASGYADGVAQWIRSVVEADDE